MVRLLVNRVPVLLLGISGLDRGMVEKFTLEHLDDPNFVELLRISVA